MYSFQNNSPRIPSYKKIKYVQKDRKNGIERQRELWSGRTAKVLKTLNKTPVNSRKETKEQE